MKKFSILMLYVFLMCISKLTLASEYYISSYVGLSMSNNKIKFELLDRVNTEPEITKSKFKNSSVYGMAFGKKIYDNAFLEIEVINTPRYKFSEFASIDVGTLTPLQASFNTKLRTTSIFINTNYQFKNYMPAVIPYITTGIGYSNNKIQHTKLSSTDLFIVPGKQMSNFAWQVGAGLLIPVTKSLDINVVYKFRNLGKVKSSKIYTINDINVVSTVPLIKGKLYSSNVLLGVSFKF